MKKYVKWIFVVIAVLIAFGAGYALGKFSLEKEDVDPTEASEPTEECTLPETEDTEDIVQTVMSSMTLRDMVYQMMFVTPEKITGINTVTKAGETTKAALEKYPVGGIVYFSNNLIDCSQTEEMIKNTQSYSKIPLFIAVDEEGGRVARLGKNPAMGTTLLPAMRTIGDENDSAKAYEAGVTLASDLKSLGFNVDFAPVADVIVNEKNSEIGDRAFGTDAENVAEMVKKLTEGLEENGVSATLKHFPGHGSTYANTHTGYSESKRTLDELYSCELLPFKEGIEAGADFVMVSHMTLVNATEEKVPCSVSKEIITGILTEDLGYEGIIITDSFAMRAITDKYTPGEAAVKAVMAGADMILMSPDVAASCDAIVKAVENGTIPMERIEKSVRKILTLKKEKQMLANW